MQKRKLENIQKKVKGFDYSLDYNTIDFREHPELYQIGKGEQGVLLVEPYKSELLPFWRFKTPEIAEKSAHKIYKLFLKYKKEKDFVGMDMARKFLQMGYTRSRRYANHKSGKKYEGPVPIEHRGESGSHGRKILSLDVDENKAICATFFYEKWQLAKNDIVYKKLKEKHLKSTSDFVRSA
ncbi:MAG TPA: DUF4385 domain-containing protein [Gammaproteobacteria bacterium]|nr:DUF4385 domain-containing protein [Gammaproteobacteria bacterium]